MGALESLWNTSLPKCVDAGTSEVKWHEMSTSLEGCQVGKISIHFNEKSKLGKTLLGEKINLVRYLKGKTSSPA